MPSPGELIFKIIPKTEKQIDIKFIQGMIDRMSMGFFKYGPIQVGFATSSAIPYLEKRLDKYHETGNTEWLMDVANFAMIEFMFPQHSNAHYRATESHESPDNSRKKMFYKRDGD